MASPINQPGSAQLNKNNPPTTARSSLAIAQIVEKFRSDQHQLHSADRSMDDSVVTHVDKNQMLRKAKDDAELFRQEIASLLTANPTKNWINIPGWAILRKSHLQQIAKILSRINVSKEDFIAYYRWTDDDFYFCTADKIPTIIGRVWEGNLEGLEEDIAAGQKDALDPDHKTALMWAMRFASKKIVDALLKAGANLHVKDKSDRSVFDYAVLANNLELVKLLILLGATPSLTYAPTHKDGKILKYLLAQNVKVPPPSAEIMDPISSSIRIGEQENAQFLIEAYNAQQMLAKHEFSKNLPVQSLLLQYIETVRDRSMLNARKILLKNSSNPETPTAYWNAYRTTKLASHSLELKGVVSIHGENINLEGHCSEDSAAAIAKSLREYASRYLKDASTLALDSLRHLRQTLHLASHQRVRNPNQLLRRINRGMPVIIHVGYADFSGHSGAFLVWNGFIVHCDRGGSSWHEPLSIYTYNPTKMNEETLKFIIDIRNHGALQYYEFIKEALPQEIDMRLMQTVKISTQTVGNCTWASLEGIVKGFLYLNQMFASGLEGSNWDDPYPRVMLNEIDRLFSGWQAFHKIQALDRYLDIGYDLKVANDAIQKLQQFDYASLHEKDYLLQIMKKYVEKSISRLNASLDSRTPDTYVNSYLTCRVLAKYEPEDTQKLREGLNEVFAKLPLDRQRDLSVRVAWTTFKTYSQEWRRFLGNSLSV